MRILYCITGLGVGGAEVITINVANWMYSAGNEVMLVYLVEDHSGINRLNPDIPVVGLQMSKSLRSFCKSQRRFGKIIRDWKPDIVHANMIHANVFCRLLRLHCRIPVLISTEHTNNVEGNMRMMSYRVTDFLSDMNTNVSEKATQLFIQKKAFSQTKSRTVYNGISLSIFVRSENARHLIRTRYGLSEDTFLFLNVGRLMPPKDQKNLITAFHRVENLYSHARLMIVGDGDLREELEEYIECCKLKGKVILTGSQEHVEDYYNAADCFVLSSAWEGFGLVLAEAMACELPVIATDSGGCAELVNDAEYMVRPRDPGALFLKMKQVYEMLEESRKVLGRRNREKAMRFDIDRICQQWLDIYKTKYHL